MYFNNHYIHQDFVDPAHKEAYDKEVRELEGREGPYTNVLLYILTANPVTREHLWEILDTDFHGYDIRPECLDAPWMTPEARFLVALAAAIAGDICAERAGRGTVAPIVADAMKWAQVLYNTYGEP